MVERPPPEPTNSDDNENSSWAESLVDIAESIAKAPPGQQLAIGGLFGWCLGYTFMKVGKVVAITVGSGLIILQIASYNGVIEVNWPNTDSRIKRWRKRLEKELGVARDPSTAEKVFQFVKDHLYLSGGLAGGFFLGIGSA